MLKPDLQARLVRAAQSCRDRGITQQQIAEALGASQSQVSRVLSGRGQRFSRLTEEVCEYVELGVRRISKAEVRQNDDLVEAIQETWDGSSSHARALAAVIRSLGMLGNSERRPQLREGR